MTSLEYKREYRKKNREKLNNQARILRKKNIEKFRTRDRKEQLERYHKLTPELKKKRAAAHAIRHLKRTYGLTKEDYNQMLAIQNNNCALCGLPLSKELKKTDPCVDHCHNTGKVRGLVHRYCNVIIGIAENKELMQKVTNYLTPNVAH